MTVRLVVMPEDTAGDRLVMLLDAESALGPPTWFSPDDAIKELTQVIQTLRNDP